MQSALLVIHVLLSLSLIGLVLIQQGKGADAGAAFGGGASSSVFGSSGAGSFLTKLTTGLAIAFFVTSLGLAYISASEVADTSIVEQLSEEEQNSEASEKALEQNSNTQDDLPANNIQQESGDLPLQGSNSVSPPAAPADLPAN